jgi:long-chain fatty acid transport protein
MKTTSILLVTGLATTAHANGFLLNEFDASQTGRGNAGTATDVEPSSIYYNVGGVALGVGTQVMVSAAAVAPVASFTPIGTDTEFHSKNDPALLPAVFATTRLPVEIGDVRNAIGLGIGVTSPFGLSVGWPITAPIIADTRTADLKTIFISPAIGVDLGALVPGLGIGGGVDFVPATVELNRAVFFGEEVGNSHLTGTGFGVGARVGAMYAPPQVPWLSAGVMWRSQVTLDITGDGDFSAPMPFRALLPPDGDVATTINLPQQVSMGLAVRPIEGLEVEANTIWTDWSVFKNLDISVPVVGGGMRTIPAPRDYKNTWTWRAGAEYRFQDSGFAMRAGYIYDPTPVRSEFLLAELPDVNRNDITVGFTAPVIDNIAAHFAFLWVIPTSRETSMVPEMPVNKGTYEVTAYVASLTIAGRWGSVIPAH